MCLYFVHWGHANATNISETHKLEHSRGDITGSIEKGLLLAVVFGVADDCDPDRGGRKQHGKRIRTREMKACWIRCEVYEYR